MSDMQLYLIALGAIIIAAVILFNWWQERRLSQDAIRRFDGPETDALMQDTGAMQEPPFERTEPDFDVEETPSEAEEIAEADDAPVEPTINIYSEDTLLSSLPGAQHDEYPEGQATAEETAAIEDTVSYAPPDGDIDPPSLDGKSNLTENIVDDPDHVLLPESVNELVDLVAMIRFDESVTGSGLREALQPLPVMDKAVQWYGLGEDAQWHPLTKDQEQSRFNHLVSALQLADRSGPVSSESLRNFHIKVESVADHLHGRLVWHMEGDSARYASELDQFCIDVDVMVGFHIINGSQGPFAATKLRGLAEAGGMTLQEDGAFHFKNDAGETLFTLISQDHRPFTQELLRSSFIRGISFQMDVPRVRNCPEAFNQMAMLARKMESSLAGMLIDDNQLPLSQSAIDLIRDQLRVIYAKMVARGIIPGSPTALRLFS